MSRIAKEPVIVPQGVEVTLDGQKVTIKSKKGEMSLTLHPTVGATFENNELKVCQKEETQESNMQSGTARALLHNMVVGLDKGFEKALKLVGVGYRAAKQGKDLVLNIGFSHQVIMPEIDGISIEVPDPNKIVISGPDKQMVGQFAAEVREKRPPEPYKGKGIKYVDEHVRRKEGKAGKGGK